MSVADGQLFLQQRNGSAGWVVSPRDSVSRIGGDAAAPALRSLGALQMRLDLAQALHLPARLSSILFAGRGGHARRRGSRLSAL